MERGAGNEIVKCILKVTLIIVTKVETIWGSGHSIGPLRYLFAAIDSNNSFRYTNVYYGVTISVCHVFLLCSDQDTEFYPTDNSYPSSTWGKTPIAH